MSATTSQNQEKLLTELLKGVKGVKGVFKPALPVVHQDKQSSSILATIGAGIVTFGNALAAAGMAFFTISQVLSPVFAVISCAGTGLAMSKLYGETVFPSFQKFLTN